MKKSTEVLNKYDIDENKLSQLVNNYEKQLIVRYLRNKYKVGRIENTILGTIVATYFLSFFSLIYLCMSFNVENHVWLVFPVCIFANILLMLGLMKITKKERKRREKLKTDAVDEISKTLYK